MKTTVDTYTDNQLWDIVEQRLPLAIDIQLSQLTDKGKMSQLSAAEMTELDTLIDQYDDYILRRSQALFMLKQRGYDIEAYLTSKR